MQKLSVRADFPKFHLKMQYHVLTSCVLQRFREWINLFGTDKHEQEQGGAYLTSNAAATTRLPSRR